MDTADLTKEWFVTHEGQQFGPVSIDDLKYEAERGELNPRLDMVWKQGMTDWIPSGKLEGLFDKNEEAEAVEKKKEEGPAPSDFQPEESKQTRMLMKGKWGGTSRSGFIFMAYVFPIIWILGISYLAKFLEGKVEGRFLGYGVIASWLVAIIVVFAVVLGRFKNLGMTRAWFPGLVVPLLQFWLGYRLFACPEGYSAHKKLDGIGWVLGFLYLDSGRPIHRDSRVRRRGAFEFRPGRSLSRNDREFHPEIPGAEV